MKDLYFLSDSLFLPDITLQTFISFAKILVMSLMSSCCLLGECVDDCSAFPASLLQYSSIVLKGPRDLPRSKMMSVVLLALRSSFLPLSHLEG